MPQLADQKTEPAHPAHKGRCERGILQPVLIVAGIVQSLLDGKLECPSRSNALRSEPLDRRACDELNEQRIDIRGEGAVLDGLNFQFVLRLVEAFAYTRSSACVRSRLRHSSDEAVCDK